VGQISGSRKISYFWWHNYFRRPNDEKTLKVVLFSVAQLLLAVFPSIFGGRKWTGENKVEFLAAHMNRRK
jgi:hypothetical protein